MAVDEEHLFITWLSLEALHLLGSFVEFSLGERERNGMGAEWERSRGEWTGNAALLANSARTKIGQRSTCPLMQLQHWIKCWE